MPAPDRPAGSWPGFCVVGLGGHARTKLVPAIAANGQALVGVVSRQPGQALPDAPQFATIEAAIDAMPAEAAFLIASPPSVHFPQAMAALRAGRDVVVEKPAFLTAAQARAAADAAEASGAVLVEAFMHRHTRLYERLLADWRAGESEVDGLDIVFVVPELPDGTFRQAPDIEASVLYDIGCYALSLLADLGLPLDQLSLDRLERTGAGSELVHIQGDCGGKDVNIRVGAGGAYENWVTLRRGPRSDRYAPFFYGRPGTRTIIRSEPGRQAEEQAIEDANAFMAILAVPRAHWAATQGPRLRDLVTVAGSLEGLGARLLAMRG